MMTVEEYKLHYALNDEVTPKDDAEQMVYTLIAEFANDKNSSKYREDITKLVVGLRPSEGKLGYDDDTQPIEVKPHNYTGTDKLCGKGNFSDFTWKRHHKYMGDKVVMLVSGFNRGKLLYVIEFPYSNLQERVEHQLKQKLPNGDVKGTYVRNTQFQYNHWSDKQYVVRYVHPKLSQLKPMFNKKFYSLLEKHNGNPS